MALKSSGNKYDSVASGTTGQQVTPPAGDDGAIRYNTDEDCLEVFNRGKGEWECTGRGVSTGDTPPTNPGEGDLWFDIITGTLFIYLCDDTGSNCVWVDASPSCGGGGGSGGSSGGAPVLGAVGDVVWGACHPTGMSGVNTFTFGYGDTVTCSGDIYLILGGSEPITELYTYDFTSGGGAAKYPDLVRSGTWQCLGSAKTGPPAAGPTNMQVFGQTMWRRTA